MNIKINKKDLKKNYQHMQNIYNVSIILENFCEYREEIIELNNIHPIIKFLRDESDKLCYNFSNIIYKRK